VVLYKTDGTPITVGSAGVNVYEAGVPVRNMVGVVSHPPVGKTKKDRAYLYEITNANENIGDICKHLTDKGWAPAGKKWRMPTLQEYAYAAFNGLGISTEITSTDDRGMLIVDYGFLSSDGSAFLPASGGRYYGAEGFLSGSSNHTGRLGAYWSSSVWDNYHDPNGGCLYIYDGSSSGSEISEGVMKEQGYAIRCVQVE